jgi:hypothetical protein
MSLIMARFGITILFDKFSSGNCSIALDNLVIWNHY